MPSFDWSLAPAISLVIPHQFRVHAEVYQNLYGPGAQFSIVVSAIGFNTNFAASVSGGGTISTGSPWSGVPFLYTAPDTPSGPPIVTIFG